MPFLHIRLVWPSPNRLTDRYLWRTYYVPATLVTCAGDGVAHHFSNTLGAPSKKVHVPFNSVPWGAPVPFSDTERAQGRHSARAEQVCGGTAISLSDRPLLTCGDSQARLAVTAHSEHVLSPRAGRVLLTLQTKE